MNIELTELTVRDLTKGYQDNNLEGVIGFDGKLDIRPAYQREFVYNDKQRKAVIHTITKGFPLNVMYWAVNDNDTFEIIDGQQRTISISQYVNGDFDFDNMYFHNLTNDEQNEILDYKLTVYRCSGTDREKLDWFKTINIAGEKLTDQELRNAVYSGTWVSDAKRYFSKPSCPAHGIGSKYLNGSPIRQDYFETVLKWISNDSIESYMAAYQHNPDASAIWSYFTDVINWVESTFPTYRKQMKGLKWGMLYNQHKDDNLDPIVLEKEIQELIADEDVQNLKGIYLYVLTRKEKHLSLRAFDDMTKAMVYLQQHKTCPSCHEQFELEDMQADHIDPWSKGGKTTVENCQMMCAPCNRRKSDK